MTVELGAIGIEPTSAPSRAAIPSGRDESEMRQRFRALLDVLQAEPDLPLVFDISHGFRSLPFFAATALAKLAASGRLPEDLRIVYGSLLPAAKGEGKRGEIRDLTAFLLQRELALGIAILARSGHGGTLVEALERERRRLAERVRRGEREEYDRVAGVITAINNNTPDLAALRGPSLIPGHDGGKSSAAALIEAVDRYREACAQDHPALLPLLDQLGEIVRRITASTLSGDEGRRAMLALAELHHSWDHPLETAAVIREGYVSVFASGPEEIDVGRPDFDIEQRLATELGATERRAYRANDYRSVARIRNDLLHAAFRADPLRVSRVARNARGALEMLKRASLHRRNTRTPGATSWSPAIRVRRSGLFAERQRWTKRPTISAPPPSARVMW